MDYVRAEQAIRTALSDFRADQDRWVKTYILTRVLESRVQKSSRADLVHLAFHLGGPIVLAGIYHATNDSHRNVRNRETLEFLLQAPQGTLQELFGRANRFPCNTSMGGWLRRIMAKLPLDAKDLACLIVALGVADIPQCLFTRAREPTSTWGSNGEVSPVATSVTLMVRNEERFGEALRALESVRLITVTDQSIEVNSRFKELLGDWGQDAKWKSEAVRLVCHAFPKSAIIELE
ncbi:hypothetical protein PG991_001765 [Apiospora marii]|uniref:Uncharacterized protein n=1 Tax=Apiospora marii TaxID=335849 RepID=A0ABR1SNB9_9PEZI